MRVLALGGSGGMGRFAVRASMKIPGVTKMTIADLNGEAASSFAASLDGDADGIALDVSDEPALRSAMRDADVLLNTTGPFYKFGVPILQAAIECGCHYFDICDDWEPTLEMFKLDSAAREADITAVIGLGASPGFSNILGLVAMRELDSVHTLYTGWDMGVAIPEEETSQSGANAAMQHAIQQMIGTVRVHQDGEEKMVRPLERVPVKYPGVGEFPALIFGHPEAVTFPHHYPEIQTSLNLCYGLDGDEKYVRLMRWCIEHKLLSAYNGARIMGWMEAQNTKASEIATVNPDRLPPIFGLAIGTKDGKPASAGAAVAGVGPEAGMGYVTGVPLACGLELLLEGKLTQRGVFAPEHGAIDPEDFFTAFAAKSDQPEEQNTDTDMPIITRSWDSDPKSVYTTAIKRINETAR